MLTPIVVADVGEGSDWTSIVAIESSDDGIHQVRHIERARQLRYADLLERLRPVVASFTPRPDIVGRPTMRVPPYLVLDVTGVGRPVFEFIRNAKLNVYERAAYVTAGDDVIEDFPYWRIPKRDLVSSVALALEAGRLEIAADLPEAPLLERELKTFKARVRLSGQDEDWRDRKHDDLVLAVAIGIWAAVEMTRPSIVAFTLSWLR
jgi:hypothetical protein